MCFAQGSRGEGEGDRENQSDGGLGKASVQNFAGFDCQVSEILSYGSAFFFSNPNLAFISPPRFISFADERR
jgi:hypothetical protein